MTRSGILEIRNDNDEVVHTAFITQENLDSFLDDKLADKTTGVKMHVLNSESRELHSIRADISGERRKYALVYIPRILAHVPKLTLSDSYISSIISRKPMWCRIRD